MATNSPRLGLILPEEGDYLDDGVMSGNFAKLDSNSGAFVCTSTTRPSAPYEGMLILETDTKNVKVRIGSAWRNVSMGDEWASLASNLGANFEAYTGFEEAAILRNGTDRTLRGMIRLKAAAGDRTGPTPLTILTLPEGDRPAVSSLQSGVVGEYRRVTTSGAASTGTAHTHPITIPMISAAMRIDVLGNGNVQLNLSSFDTFTAGSYVSLAGIKWSVA